MFGIFENAHIAAYLEEFSIGFIGHEFAVTLVLQIWNSRALVVYNVHLYRLSLSKVTKQ